MKNLFVPYELSLKLKGKGFDEPCFGYYNQQEEFKICINDNSKTNKVKVGLACIAPIHQQVIDWFIEKHKIYIWVQLYGNSFEQEYIPCYTTNLNPNNTKELYYMLTYYEALTKAIEEAIKLI